MTKRLAVLAAVALPPLALSALGLGHPAMLHAESAGWWTTLHLVLLVVFPLLAVAIWVLLRNDTTVVGWGGRVAAVVYLVFYGGLDAIAGVAAGTVMTAGHAHDSPAVEALFAVARPLGIVGGYAFFIAVVFVLVSAWRAGRRGWLFVVAALILLPSSFLLPSSHIYWPRGGLVMIGLAVGFVMLELIPRAVSATRSAEP